MAGYSADNVKIEPLGGGAAGSPVQFIGGLGEREGQGKGHGGYHHVDCCSPSLSRGGAPCLPHCLPSPLPQGGNSLFPGCQHIIISLGIIDRWPSPRQKLSESTTKRSNTIPNYMLFLQLMPSTPARVSWRSASIKAACLTMSRCREPAGRQPWKDGLGLMEMFRCLVTFIPQHPGTYVIDVSFNGEAVHGTSSFFLYCLSLQNFYSNCLIAFLPVKNSC